MDEMRSTLGVGLKSRKNAIGEIKSVGDTCSG